MLKNEVQEEQKRNLRSKLIVLGLDGTFRNSSKDLQCNLQYHSFRNWPSEPKQLIKSPPHAFLEHSFFFPSAYWKKTIATRNLKIHQNSLKNSKQRVSCFWFCPHWICLTKVLYYIFYVLIHSKTQLLELMLILYTLFHFQFSELWNS